MTRLSKEALELIARESSLDDATPEEVARLAGPVYAALGRAPPVEIGSHPLPGVAGTSGMSAIAKGMLVGFLTMGIGVGGYLASQRNARVPAPQSPPPPVHSLPPHPIVAANPPLALSAGPVASAVPRPAAHKRRPVPKPQDSSSAGIPSAPQEEALLVATAGAQLRAGNAAQALVLYERHLKLYPRGLLRHESTIGRIRALCRLGRSEEGRAALQRLPKSSNHADLERACGGSR